MNYSPTQIIDVRAKYDALLASDAYIDTRAHLPFLREVAKGNVLEIGTDVGNSTTAILLGVKEKGGHLTSVDIKDCSHLFDDPQWSFINTDSKELYFMDLPVFDVVYVDGNHSSEWVISDIDLAMGMTREGGIVLVHDVLAPQFPDVRHAFDSLADYVPKTIREGSWGLGVIQC